MRKTLLRSTGLALLLLSSSGMADNLQDKMDNIVLTDESSNLLQSQATIVGCDDTLKIDELKCSKERTPRDRDEEIDKIKTQLTNILKQLSELKQNGSTDANKIKSIGKEIKVLEIKSDHVIVEVQSGESLSKYAQKYYDNGRKYQAIYRANPGKISKNLQIFIGDKLIIPTTDTYQYVEEQKPKEKSEVLDIP